jgi:FMN phosphatase YigB (HAD superfamily)
VWIPNLQSTSLRATTSVPSKLRTMQIKTYAFDLDGTLCTLTDGNYETAEPFLDRIMHVNKLFEEGHTILIFTARGATSNRDLRDFTIEQLKNWGLKYERLIMGKPHFDLLVDDKAINEREYFQRLRT